MFMNPWRADEASWANIEFARRFFAIYLCWRLVSYPWGELAIWPEFVFQQRLGVHLPSQFLFLKDHLWLLSLIGVACLIGSLVTKRVVLMSVSAVAICIVLGAFHQCVDNQGKRMMVPAFIMLLFAIFHHATRHRESKVPLPASNPLCWILLMISVTYVVVICQRVVQGDIVAWSTADNLLRTLRWEAVANLRIEETIGTPLMVHHRWIASILAVMPTFVELALCACVVFKRRIGLACIALIGLHLGIFVSMHLLFIESIALLCIFLDWDRILTTLKRPLTSREEPVADVAV